MNEPWQREDKPFNFSATGYLGVKRPTMLSNQLLQKSRVGVANPQPHTLPRDTTFGEEYRCPWTAAHALTGWSGHPLYPEKKKKEKKPTADFVQLNRGAITGVMTTADDFHGYRKLKVPIKSLGAMKAPERPAAKVFKPTDVYGKPNIPNSNIADLVTGEYQKQWLQTQRVESGKRKKKIDLTKVRPTRASLLRPHIVRTRIHRPPWRSPFFLRKALPRIATFRSQKALEDAWASQTLESSGREGEAGQGILMSKPHEHWPPPLPGDCQP